MAHTLRDGSNTQDRRLDRIGMYDRRSLDFPVQSALNQEQQKLISKRWATPPGTPVLDQGRQGACVGFGITHELLFYPVPIRDVDADFAREKIYWVAQEADPWPGGSYPNATPVYEGTSVLYGMKAAADLGYYKEYRWATSENELALGVGYLGPAIIGVDWYDGMFEPDSKGFIRLTGDKMGGHCCLIIGINIRAGYYTIRNSWGSSWGEGGNCKISREDMAKLIADNGEACIVSQRTVPAPGKKAAARIAHEHLTD